MKNILNNKTIKAMPTELIRSDFLGVKIQYLEVNCDNCNTPLYSEHRRTGFRNSEEIREAIKYKGWEDNEGHFKCGICKSKPIQNNQTNEK